MLNIQIQQVLAANKKLAEMEKQLKAKDEERQLLQDNLEQEKKEMKMQLLQQQVC